MLENSQTRGDLLQFLSTIALPHRQVESINDDENLIEAGIIDSLSLVHIIIYLESNHNVDFQASGVNPNEIGSVAGMLAAIEQQIDP